jgi:hypothetical protein
MPPNHLTGDAAWAVSPCLDILARIAPARVLTVGVASEHWRALLRASGVRVESIGSSEPGALAAAGGDWDVVLHGLDSSVAPGGAGLALLEASLERGAYVVAAVRRGDYGPNDWGAVARLCALDWNSERGLGVVCLSRADPVGLRSEDAPACDVAGRSRVETAATGLSSVLEKVAETVYELRYVRHNSLHRAAVRLRRTAVWHAVRWLRNRNADVVEIRALGTRGAGAGSEVWLLEARDAADDLSVPWDFVEHDGSWHPHHDDAYPYGRCLVSSGGWLRVPVGPDPELLFLRHPWSGRVAVTFRGTRRILDLHDPVGGRVRVRPARDHVEVLADAAPAERGGVRPVDAAVDDVWVESTRAAAPRAIAIHCPRWLGVSNSTRNLFAHTYPIPAHPDLEPRHVGDRALARHADTLLATGVRHFVVSGGDEIYLRLVEAVRTRAPETRFDLLWHGSYVHFADSYHWFLMQRWLDLARAGVVTTIGTVKAGMERFFTRLGVRSALVLNYVPGDVLDPPPASEADLDVGIWISGVNPLKSPHAMLSALAMTPGVRLHGAGTGGDVRALAEAFGIRVAALSDEALPAAALEAAIRRTQVTLYVTFSECCPMLPLESLRLGVPALIGPTSHLFDDHDYLRERLVVPHPDRADTIAAFLRLAADERVRIVDAYRDYAPIYHARARRSVEAFLD